MYFFLFLLFCSFDFTYEIGKPMVDERWKNRFRKPFHPAWMDYCDPYHCNDYHKLACGLSRKSMRFQWFQSQCHIILNNLCSRYRGSLEYDPVETKYCTAYVLHLRDRCPSDCPDVTSPTCAVNVVDGHVMLFKNLCVMTKANCQEDMLEEYDAVDIKVCQRQLSKIINREHFFIEG